MTTIPPPSQQFTGIFYNPSFWISSATSLTQAVANTLYLRKTTTDTASALETFNGGISTQSMTAPSLTADVDLFPNQTAGTLKLATASRSVHCSNIECQGSAINNASTPATGALTIGASQTSGTISIGTGASRTGSITIGANNCTINQGGHVAPTWTVAPASGELGFLTINTLSGASLTLGTSSARVGATASLTTGVWLIQGNCQLPFAVAGIVVTLSLSASTSLNEPCIESAITTTTANVYMNFSTVVVVSGTQAWGLSGLASTGLTIAVGRFCFTRIA